MPYHLATPAVLTKLPFFSSESPVTNRLLQGSFRDQYFTISVEMCFGLIEVAVQSFIYPKHYRESRSVKCQVITPDTGLEASQVNKLK